MQTALRSKAQLFLILGWIVGVGSLADARVIGAWTFDEGQGTTLADVSGNGRSGQIVGGTWIEGRFGKALAFDAETYAEIPDPGGAFNPSCGLTVAVWAQIKALPEANGGLIRKTDLQDSAGWLLRATNDGASGYRMWIFAHINGAWVCFETGDLPFSDAWHHFCATYDSATVRLFVDGHPHRTEPRPGSIDPGDGPLRASRDSFTILRTFVGGLDDLVILDEALPESEIRRLMEEGISRFIGG